MRPLLFIDDKNKNQRDKMTSLKNCSDLAPSSHLSKGMDLQGKEWNSRMVYWCLGRVGGRST
jgi:hypothetical protein